MVTPELERIRGRAARRQTALALLLALGAHGLFAVLLAVASALFPAPPPQRAPQQVALRALSPEQWAMNRRIAADGAELEHAGDARPADAAGEEPKAEKEKKPPEERESAKEWALAPQGNQAEDPDAKRYATSSNQARKETVARDTTAYYRNVMPRRTRVSKPEEEGLDPVDQVMRSGNGGRGAEDAPEAHAGKGPGAMELPSIQRRDEVRLRDEGGAGPGPEVANQTGSDAVKGSSDRLVLGPGQGFGGGVSSMGRAGDPGLANLTPSPGVLDKIAGAAPNVQPEDVEEGDATLLNTKEWKYAGFMNRVTQSVGTQWDPNALLSVRDPTGRIYGGRDRFTRLEVTLDEAGEVKQITVKESCGVEFLDQEAVHAFERVERFPNPPRAMLARDSNFHLELGFLITYHDSPKIKMFGWHD